jgi:hypothetical protein
MNTNRTRLVAGVLCAVVLSVPLAAAIAPKILLNNLRGQLHIVQAVPCGAVLDFTTSVADGRMELTPVARSRSGQTFDLTRLDMFFTPFSVEHECLGMTATVEFKEIGVRLAKPVTFEALGDSHGGLFRFSIPKEQVLIFESVVDNLPVPQPETAYQTPSEDVTGEIDLRGGTAQLHIALSSMLRFKAGCVGKKCVIDQALEGSQRVDITAMVVSPTTDTDRDGVPDVADSCPLVDTRHQARSIVPVNIAAPANVTLSSCQVPDFGTAQAVDVCNARPLAVSNDAPASFAIGRNVVTWTASNGIDRPVTTQQVVTITADDRTAPAVSCTADNAGMFKVAAADDCGGRTALKLGSFGLSNDEVIKIEETGKPGVRLVNTVGTGKIRHFQVGKGEALVVATDASGNSARVACGPAPLEASRTKR